MSAYHGSLHNFAVEELGVAFDILQGGCRVTALPSHLGVACTLPGISSTPQGHLAVCVPHTLSAGCSSRDVPIYASSTLDSV